MIYDGFCLHVFLVDLLTAYGSSVCFRQCLQLESTSTSRCKHRLLNLVRIMISFKHHDAVIDDE